MNRTLLLGSRQQGLPRDGLVALYLFNEGSGQVLTDYSGNGYHGTLGSTAGDDTNDPTWTGQGLAFATDDYVTIPARSAVGTRLFVLTMAAGWSAISTGLYQHGGVNQLFTSNANATEIVIPIGSPFSLVVVSPTTEQMDLKFYLNGGGPTGSVSVSATVPQDTRLGNCATTVYLTGTFHAAVYWDRVLSSSEISRSLAAMKAILAPRGVILP